MPKLRVLWLCNTPIDPARSVATGSWMQSMVRLLGSSSPEVELAVVAAEPHGTYGQTAKSPMPLWTVPFSAAFRGNGRADSCLRALLSEACDAFAPDIIHVWGTESRFGLLAPELRGPRAVLVTVQGIKHQIGRYLSGGLNRRERFSSFGRTELLKVLLRGRVAPSFRRWEHTERQIVGQAHRVMCQTPWQMAYARQWSPEANIDLMDLPLREEFQQAGSWQANTGSARLLVSSAYASPAKGLHIAVRALGLLVKEFPLATLRIAGPGPGKGLLPDGYLRWVVSESRRLGAEGRVVWLGMLTPEAMATEIRECSAVVVPTFIESYCMAMAEAQYIGAPVVASFTGGTSYLGQDEQTCLFFPPGDVAMCSQQLGRVLRDEELASRLSTAGRSLAATRNDGPRIAAQQTEVYRSMAANRDRTMAVSSGA